MVWTYCLVAFAEMNTLFAHRSLWNPLCKCLENADMASEASLHDCFVFGRSTEGVLLMFANLLLCRAAMQAELRKNCRKSCTNERGPELSNDCWASKLGLPSFVLVQALTCRGQMKHSRTPIWFVEIWSFGDLNENLASYSSIWACCTRLICSIGVWIGVRIQFK